MEYRDTVIIGAGQAGLALSHWLRSANLDHVILERGRLAERWRSERWDSLHMLTPNWMTRLPGRPGEIADPAGFMSKDAVVNLLEDYASSFGAPVRERTEVTAVRRNGEGFVVVTERGAIHATNVVVATGHCGEPVVPGPAAGLDPAIDQLHAAHYRNPRSLNEGGVLIVGAGASGLQIAAELRETGRPVTLATGRHARAVRSYRGRDLWWWLEQIGALDQTVEDVADIEAARQTPSLGLSGSNGGEDIDLASLDRAGVGIGGRLTAASGARVRFDDNLEADLARSEERLRHLLDRFDAWAEEERLTDELGPSLRPVPVRIRRPVTGELDLRSAGIRTVLWATGYRQSYPWLEIPVLDADGGIEHRRGVTAVPGLYVLGMRFQWRRGSHFLDGVGRDAEFLAGLIAGNARATAVA